MNFTNTFFDLMSLTNLTLFVNRLIHDGPYQSATLVYDYESIRDTNFIQKLLESPNRQYAIATVCVNKSEDPFSLWKKRSYRYHLNAMYIVLVNDALPHYYLIQNTISRHNVMYRPHIVFLLPMQFDT